MLLACNCSHTMLSIMDLSLDLIRCLHHYICASSLWLSSTGIQVFPRKWVIMYSPSPESVQEAPPPLESSPTDRNQLGTPKRTRELEKPKWRITDHGITTVANSLMCNYVHLIGSLAAISKTLQI